MDGRRGALTRPIGRPPVSRTVRASACAEASHGVAAPAASNALSGSSRQSSSPSRSSSSNTSIERSMLSLNEILVRAAIVGRTRIHQASVRRHEPRASRRSTASRSRRRAVHLERRYQVVFLLLVQVSKVDERLAIPRALDPDTDAVEVGFAWMKVMSSAVSSSGLWISNSTSSYTSAGTSLIDRT